MSHFLDRLKFLSADKEEFSNGHGVTVGEDRTWEDAYRSRWQHDKLCAQHMALTVQGRALGRFM